MTAQLSNYVSRSAHKILNADVARVIASYFICYDKEEAYGDRHGSRETVTFFTGRQRTASFDFLFGAGSTCDGSVVHGSSRTKLGRISKEHGQTVFVLTVYTARKCADTCTRTWGPDKTQLRITLDVPHWPDCYQCWPEYGDDHSNYPTPCTACAVPVQTKGLRRWITEGELFGYGVSDRPQDVLHLCDACLRRINPMRARRKPEIISLLKKADLVPFRYGDPRRDPAARKEAPRSEQPLPLSRPEGKLSKHHVGKKTAPRRVKPTLSGAARSSKIDPSMWWV